jgi:hypothetical protein
MSQAQDAMLGNLPNGIVTTLASHYVTNVMNADPETKLGYGQNAPLGFTAFATCNMLCYLTLADGPFKSFIPLCACRRQAEELS